MAQKPPLGSGERFRALVRRFVAEGTPEKVARARAAAIGRRKYGKKRFQELAAAGRSRHHRLRSKRMRALFNR
jgi:hypothetical protein